MTEPAAKKMNMIEAINSALDVMLAKDPEVVIMGEDVGYFGVVAMRLWRPCCVSVSLTVRPSLSALRW